MRTKYFQILSIILIFNFSLFAEDAYIENANDICYETLEETGINFGSASFMYKTNIPIKSLSTDTLTSVNVALGSSSLFSAFKDCGVDDVTGSCEDASGLDFMMFSAFTNGVNFSLQDLTQNKVTKPYTKSLFSFFNNNNYDLVASYTKNNQKYRGVIQPCAVESSGGRDFELRHQENLFGNVKVLGNTVLCLLNKNGQCIKPPKKSNDKIDLQKAPISYSTLKMPAKSTIIYARLYWQGRGQQSTKWNENAKNLASTIQLKNKTDSWHTFHADILDINQYTNGKIPIYSASAVVTDYIKAHGNGKYYLNTKQFYTHTGATWYQNPKDGLGSYGAWVLVVVYQDPNETKARNVSIFDGYKTVNGKNIVPVSVNGFLTPKFNKVDSKLYTFIAEGDKYIVGDDFLMAGELHNTILKSIAPNNNNAFDSRIDILNTPRNPDLKNNNGIDIQEYDVGTTSGAEHIITNNEIGAKFQFKTDGDAYFPSLLVFSTEIYLPKMCYDYSIKQDGQYMQINRGDYPEAQIDGKISSSDLDITVYLRNMEADIPAEGIAIKSDINDSVFDSVGHIFTSNTNGTTLIDRGSPYQTNPLCIYDQNGDNSTSNRGCTNGHDIRKGNGTLKAGEYVYTKFTLQPKNVSSITDINESLGLSVRYYITINQHKSVYPDYILGSKNVPLCPTSGWYQAQKGIFNVVHRGQIQNVRSNLFTQVSRQPFDVSVIFDSTPENADYTAPTSDVNTTVLVEMIDLDSFGDLNASCANPDSKISDSIFVPIDFSQTNYQTDVLTQPNNYYDVAVKNAAFRVWYFSDGNNSLIEGWHALTSNYNKHVDAISGLYTDARFPLCKDICSLNPTTAQCFDCIKNNYAKPICSRDNFAIRPESYDVEIYDDNQTLANNKINLSQYYNYSPNSQQQPTGEMQLAAGYKYRFDIASTGHDGLQPTPGYTRYFNGKSDYNATLIWNSQKTNTICNDIENKDLTFYVKNGTLSDEHKEHTNVGEYKFNIIDTSWTAVDWDWTKEQQQYRQANNFSANEDCTLNSNSTEKQFLKIGCTINTNHGSVSTSSQQTYTYKDTNIIFHPFKFDISNITPTIGITNNQINNNAFIYMANMDHNETMSYHLDGNIIAQGEDNATLSNFTSQCYAKAIDIVITTSDRTLFSPENIPIKYIARFHDINKSGPTISSLDINYTDYTPQKEIHITTTETPQKGYFLKDYKGNMYTSLNLNYERNITLAVNPKQIYFKKYIVTCKNSAECAFSANMTNNTTTKGEETLNVNIPIKHYYGRVHAQRERFLGTDGDANLSYEVYCDISSGGDKSLLQQRNNSKYTDDPRWFINLTHSPQKDGQINTITQRGYPHVSLTKLTNTSSPVATLHYDGTKGFPYITTMQVFPSSWLIYNKYNNNVKLNEFEVEFINSSGNWAGERGTDSTTKKNAANITNRRLMW